MYGGQLPIKDPTTLNLVTNKLALLINSHSSSDMRVGSQWISVHRSCVVFT